MNFFSFNQQNSLQNVIIPSSNSLLPFPTFFVSVQIRLSYLQARFSRNSIPRYKKHYYVHLRSGDCS